jgi:DNA polymerase I-like protein with 3'-5' exonuclease and polymerase domains
LFCRSEFKGLNVLLQSAGALLMKQVVINIAKNLEEQNLIYGTDWMQVAMVHDEVQLACLPQHKELVKEQALLAFPQAQKYFNFLCKIEGDAKIGYTWLDCH